MSAFRKANRTTTVMLLALLVVEILLTVSMRSLGWLGTGDAIHLVACVFMVALPLLVAGWLVTRNRLRFSLRSMLLAVALVAVFLAASLRPLVNYRSARSVSAQLLSAGATLNRGADSWHGFYTNISLTPPAVVSDLRVAIVPPWLTPLTDEASAVPPDNAVRRIDFDNDEQVHIFTQNGERFSSLQYVGIAPGVTQDGFKALEKILPRLEHLDTVVTNDVATPEHWYRSLVNVRTLFVWGEGASRGRPFPDGHASDIAALPNLEVLMVLGFAFDDLDARTLSDSASLKRIILRGTAVTPAGVSRLSDTDPDRIVYRN